MNKKKKKIEKKEVFIFFENKCFLLSWFLKRSKMKSRFEWFCGHFKSTWINALFSVEWNGMYSTMFAVFQSLLYLLFNVQCSKLVFFFYSLFLNSLFFIFYFIFVVFRCIQWFSWYGEHFCYSFHILFYLFTSLDGEFVNIRAYYEQYFPQIPSSIRFFFYFLLNSRSHWLFNLCCPLSSAQSIQNPICLFVFERICWMLNLEHWFDFNK